MSIIHILEFLYSALLYTKQRKNINNFQILQIFCKSGRARSYYMCTRNMYILYTGLINIANEENKESSVNTLFTMRF